MPPSGDIFVPKASTSQYLIVFLISTFQFQQFPRFYGVSNLCQGALCPLYTPSGKIFAPEASMSNGVFNFNFLALLLSEILGGPKFTLGGPTQRRNFCTQSEYFTISNCVSTFQLEQFPRFQGVPNLCQGALCPLYTPSGKIFAPEASTLLCLMAF